MSTGLNSMCGVIFEDFLRPLFKEPISELKASWIMKCVVLIIGAICVALVFLVEHLGAIIQVSNYTVLDTFMDTSSSYCFYK